MLVIGITLLMVLGVLFEVSGTPLFLLNCLNRYLPNKYQKPFRNIFCRIFRIPVAPTIRTVISCTYTSKRGGT